jgi:U3 small nucleolar RNA-associated protein 3
MLQSSAALNLVLYLLLKSHHQSISSDNDDGDETTDPATLIQSHPVMLRLQKINSMLQQLDANVEGKVDGLKQQLDNLVKAANLMESNEISMDEEVSDQEDSVNSEEADIVEGDNTMKGGDGGEISESEDEEVDEAVVATSTGRNVLTEARFGLRPNEMARSTNKPGKRGVKYVSLEAGDDDIDEIDENQRKRAMQSLAKTVNTIEQRSGTRNRRAAPLSDHLDDHEDDDGELRRGLAMMEEQLGKMSDDDAAYGELNDEDGSADYDKDDFYDQVAKRSKIKRDVRKEIYQVQPKFPRMDPEVEGERAASKQILKNRGLVAHKAKINRNPRVKKREQYRKALIRRKGAIREIRTNEVHQYGGEETGIKSNLSRSRKLAR